MKIAAKNSQGYLINCQGKLMFRLYDGDEFIDYEIHHSDLHIKIIDDDAFFYHPKFRNEYIDHSPTTLGKENDT